MAALRDRFAGEDGPTLIPGDEIEVVFSKGEIRLGADSFRFPPLGPVPQALVISGGVENQARAKLASK